MAYFNSLTAGTVVKVHGLNSSVVTGTIHLSDERGIQLMTGHSKVPNVFYPWSGVERVERVD